MESARARAAVKRFSPAEVPQGIPYEGITKVNRSLTASLRWNDSSCWCSWLGDPRDVDGMDVGVLRGYSHLVAPLQRI